MRSYEQILILSNMETEFDKKKIMQEGTRLFFKKCCVKMFVWGDKVIIEKKEV